MKERNVLERIEELLAIASNKDKTCTMEYGTIHHDKIYCEYSVKCKWNCKPHRTINGRNQHYVTCHEDEYYERKYSLPAELFIFGDVEIVYEQCGFCAYKCSVNFIDHVRDHFKKKNLRIAETKWMNCLMINYFMNVKVVVKVSEPIELLNRICLNGFEIIRGRYMDSNIPDVLKKSLSMVQNTMEPVGRVLRYYVLHSKMLNSAYIGSTEWLMRIRNGNHKSSNKGSCKILEARDAEYCVFATSSLCHKMTDFRAIAETFEYLVMNIMKKFCGVKIVNDRQNPYYQ